MERIVLEVNEQIAKNWRYSSEKKRKQVLDVINMILQDAFKRQNDDDFIEFVKEVQDKAEKRGLTAEVLNDILNEPD